MPLGTELPVRRGLAQIVYAGGGQKLKKGMTDSQFMRRIDLRIPALDGLLLRSGLTLGFL